MWCGPLAVSKLTGWTTDQAWLHMRALREQAGERLPEKPRGGTTVLEVLSALDRAGFMVVEITCKPMPYELFRKTVGRRGRWLCNQPGHLFGYIAPGRPVPRASRIIRAYRVVRKLAY